MELDAVTLGSTVRITLHQPTPQTVEGEVFSIDHQTDTIILTQQTNQQSIIKKDYRILKISSIGGIETLNKADESLTASMLVPLPPVNINRIRMNEEKAVRQLREEQSRIGVGVSSEAQAIFNSLSKTLPCRWRGEDIIVFDEIVIKSPYSASTCSGGDPMMLDRVKKVLEGEKRRLNREKTQ
eukprot:TRINITY_DN21591_c0_g1_i1.p1 TRINITY_DN21591_c0_g1~~TRINITY_DN21591_c0_g1_i1.p1  ORF type:complete len:183 (-),score=30.51 TRINITY_DN21591_c0_g1_i1:177-725(-)